MSKRKAKILFQMTGSIACYKACSVVSRLVQNGCEVKVMCSANALNFIGRATLEGLTKNDVLSDMFAGKSSPAHVEIAEWADLAIVCPATANIVSKMAAGLADDCVTTTFLSFPRQKPYLAAPAMNEKMLLHPATQKSLETLRSWGIKILEPGEGWQACGAAGAGRMAEPEKIYEKIMSALDGLK